MHWADDVVITLVCIPLLHHTANPASQYVREENEDMEEREIRSHLKKRGREKEGHGLSEMEVYQKCLTGFKWTS